MSARKPHPDAQLLVDPKPGDLCIFKYAGGWHRGLILSTPEGWERISIKRPDAATPKMRRNILWRNRTQIYAVRSVSQP